MFKFKLTYVALAAALTSISVYADPVYTHLSGTQVIDIEAPNAAGVSHNIYREFNVSDKGLILNNSASDTTHSTLGNIAKNNNLKNGSASVILNEVTSTKSSALNGFIEVNGQKADVIIANPNGISCSGCSFVNTNKVVLTTGQVNLSDTGAISSYSVNQGNITVDGNGLNADKSYVALLADAINLNGVVNANNALVSAGNFTMDNNTTIITSAGKKATVMQMLFPEYSIDISALGGVKANNISMIGNNSGFGVRNKGAVVANGNLAMLSNGVLVNSGYITGNGMMTQLSSASDFLNSGTISTNYLGVINSLSGFYNEGTISNAVQMAVSAGGDLDNLGVIKSDNTLMVNAGGNLTTEYGSEIVSKKALAVTSNGDINHSGSIQAEQTTVNFGGNNLKVTGNIWGLSSLLVQSSTQNGLSAGTIYNKGTIAGGDLTLQTNGTLNQEGNIDANKSLTINTNALNNYYYMNAPTLTINSNYVKNMATLKGTNVNITAAQGIYNEGHISAVRDMNLSTAMNSNITNYNTISAGGTLTMTTNNVLNGGYRCGWLGLKLCGVGSLSAQSLNLNSSHNYASNMGGKQSFKTTEIHTIN